jgi:hypothetical protein
MKNKFLLICLICIETAVLGQNNTTSVNIPDSIRSKLAEFLFKAEKLDKPYEAIYIYRVIKSSETKYTDDVYQFRLMGPHYRMRIFINDNGNLKIFEGQNTDELIKEFYDYITGHRVSEKKKIKYLNAIVIFLKKQNE